MSGYSTSILLALSYSAYLSSAQEPPTEGQQVPPVEATSTEESTPNYTIILSVSIPLSLLFIALLIFSIRRCRKLNASSPTATLQRGKQKGIPISQPMPVSDVNLNYNTGDFLREDIEAGLKKERESMESRKREFEGIIMYCYCRFRRFY